MSNKYNGWTNYATWRVNLEVLDGVRVDDIWNLEEIAQSIHEGENWPVNLAQHLNQYCKDITEGVIFDKSTHGNTTPNGVEWSDVVRMFCDVGLDMVNFREIADHMIEDYRDDIIEALAESYDMTEAEAAQMVAKTLAEYATPEWK